jgi:IclR family pca regulon transcriptional regulator
MSQPLHNATAFPIAKADTIAGLAKGLAVLESFDIQRQRINATMAAQKTGITRAAARRHLLTLASLGYLETDGSYFWLTSKVLRFSGSYMASARLPKVIQPTLNRLAAETGESMSATVLDGDEVVVVGRSGPTRFQADGLHLGARMPAYATSTGRVMLANLPRKALDAWLKDKELRRLTAHTIVEKSEFRKVLAQIRQNDYCIADQEYEFGVIAVAVPVRDPQGNTVAALNIVLPIKAVRSKERLNKLIIQLQNGAHEIRSLI